MAFKLILLVIILRFSQINAGNSGSVENVSNLRAALDWLAQKTQNLLNSALSIIQGPIDQISQLIYSIAALGDKDCAQELIQELNQLQMSVFNQIMACGQSQINSASIKVQSIFRTINDGYVALASGQLFSVASSIAATTSEVTFLTVQIATLKKTLTSCVASVLGNTMADITIAVTQCIYA